jgi:DtxR family transcriptional regulator, Mn-dependent transcriptional regulator
MESERIEEYLEAIYKRQDKSTPVSTSALAEDLGVSLPAVTDMLKHLKVHKLIDYEPSKGAALTELGKDKALAIIRRHRLWERFLTDILGMKWDKVHDEACRLEHATSPDMEKGLSSILGDVDTCPHGHAIPDESGNIKTKKAIPVSEFRPPQKLRILAVDNEDPKLLRAIEKLGLQPGTIVTVLKRNRDGSLEIEHAGKKISLDGQTAALLAAEAASAESLPPIEDAIPLGRLRTGECAVIKTYGGERGSMGRCLSLGFTPGSSIKMMENYRRGPVLVKVHDTEVAVGRQLADKISVVRVEAEC